MEWYKRSKLVFDIFQKVGSKLISKTATQCNSCSSSFYSRCEFFGSPSILSKFGYLNVLKQNKSSLASGVSRSWSSYAARNQVNNFKPRPRDYWRWIRNTKNALIVGLVGSGLAISFYFASIEVVPYTRRNPFRIVFKDLDELSESEFKKRLKRKKTKILHAKHPDSVMVRLIGKNIIDVLRHGLRNEQPALFGDSTLKTVKHWRKGELVKESTKQGAKPTNHHWDSLNWEFFVVDKPYVDNAYYSVGGKIAIYSGVLKKYKAKAEIAAYIGHEVGHAVALHSRVLAWGFMWHEIIQIVLFLLLLPPTIKATIVIAGVYAKYFLLWKRYLLRKMELEADYIGLMLMASAGYDPRLALNTFEKDEPRRSVLRHLLATHPSNKKRLKLLAKAMDEALSLYHKQIEKKRKMKKRQGIKSFH